MKENKWWLVVEAIEKPDKSGLIKFGVAMKYKNYAKLKQVVWKWYKKQLGRTELKSREKVVLYALCERYSAQDYSSHDAVSYLALMVGMNRKTVVCETVEIDLCSVEKMWRLQQGSENILHSSERICLTRD